MSYDLDRLKEAADIVEVARALGLDPQKQGARYFARCPAHDDQGRPNLALDQAKGAKCFRCDFSADIIGLAAKVKGSMKEGISFVASVAGVAPQTKGQGLGNDTRGKKGKSYPKPPPKAAPLPDRPSTYLEGLGNEAGGNGGEAYPKTSGATDGEDLPYDPAAVTWRPDGGFSVAGANNIIAFYAYHFGGLPRDDKEARQLWEELDRLLEKDRLTAEEGKRAKHIAGRVGYRGDFPPMGKPRPADVFAALLDYTAPIAGEKLHPAAAWLQEEKGITFETQAAVGLCWLNWEAADQGLRSRFDVATLKEVGLLTKEKEALHFYRHRLIFPFWYKGEPVFLQGRNFKATGKELRFIQPATASPVPYNADALAETKTRGEPVFICEGATDTLTLRQSGRFAVGIVGTQGFRREWAKAFDGLDVFLAFDGDQAGRDAAQKVTKTFLDQGLRAPQVVTIPDGQDVTEFFKLRLS